MDILTSKNCIVELSIQYGNPKSCILIRTLNVISTSKASVSRMDEESEHDPFPPAEVHCSGPVAT